MRKSILFLIAGMLMVSSVVAQSFVIKDKSGVEVTGQTVDHICPPADGFVSLGMDVFNVSDARKNVKVRKHEMAMVEGSEISICWLACYPPFIFETPDPINIEPGTFSPNFTGDITYLTTQGTTTAKFVFFDVDNPTDSSFVIVNFIIGTLGLNDNPAALSNLSNAYPNPASSNVYFDYSLPSNTGNAQIRINNLLGTTVREITLDKNEGKAQLDVNSLKNGIYFYSLMINNSATITRKFVVKR
ncbi:MAG: T9SS type A sorting domain-containing protein [Lentimicrobium sp.]|nr:T9SS type A sorting domain-containing protein [Lentimicrobium sp.]